MAVAQKNLNPSRLKTNLVSVVKNILKIKGRPEENEEPRGEAGLSEKSVSPTKRKARGISAKEAGKKNQRKNMKQKRNLKGQSQAEDASSAKASSSVNPHNVEDPAHSPGHQKLNLKKEFSEASGEKTQIQNSALNHFAPGDRINRVTSQRRMNGFVKSAGRRRRAGEQGAH